MLNQLTTLSSLPGMLLQISKEGIKAPERKNITRSPRLSRKIGMQAKSRGY